MNTELLQDLLGALNLAVFVRAGDGAFRLEGVPPAWLAGLWPQVAAEKGFAVAAEFSPFLDNFLIDAAAYWESGEGRGPGSGPWIERDAQNRETALEATALNLNGRPVLLVEQLGDRFTERTSTLQKARETVLAYERLNLEIQKKQILVHCVVNDMAAQLSNLVTSLRLVDQENTTPKVRKLTSLAALAAQKQQNLINRVFETFMQEADSLRGPGSPAGTGVELPGLVRQVAAACQTQAGERGGKVMLAGLPAEGSAPLKVVAEAGNLERLLGNLLQNALRHSPAGKPVHVFIAVEEDVVLVEIQDECSDVPHEIRRAGLEVFSAPSGNASPDALALHFCRIAVENWGGQMGAGPREPDGHTFWFRLSRAQS